MNNRSLIQIKRIFQIVFAVITAVSLIVTTTAVTALPVQAASPAMLMDIPNLLSPDNGVIVTAANEGTLTAPPQAMPVFTWETVPGATQYQIRFSQDPNFSTSIPFSTKNNFYTPSLINSFNDGDWYWQVKVSAPTASDFSPARMFTKRWASQNNAPLLLAPVDSAALEFFDNPIFSWTPVIGAASYNLRVAKDPTLLATNPNINIDTLTTKYQPINFLSNGLYYWQVTPVDPANHKGTPSEVRTFQLGYNQVPSLIEPADGSQPTFTPTFRWTAVRGAQNYQLQFSTDQTFNTNVTTLNTVNTTYTPIRALPNDKNYYWRVRAYNGSTFSSWSNHDQPIPWYFIKRWYIQPVLLTPIATFPFVRFPFYSWTPVPGAASYKIEIDRDPDFNPAELSTTTENPYYTPDKYIGDLGLRYWRVIPIDSAGNNGRPSEVSQYTSYWGNNSPDLVAPLYYYPPNTYPAPDQNLEMQPYEDRSVAYPLFTWQRLFSATDGTLLAGAYRIDVGKGMNPEGTVSQVVWTAQTHNISITPKDNEFVPVPGEIYYWQVTPLTGIGGTPVENFSQVWKTRFDPSKGLPATNGPAPQPLRPAYKPNYNPSIDPGYDSPEFVEVTPSLEWFPVNGATQYQVQISRFEDFSSTVDNATVQLPVYTPRTNFGQRSLNNLNFGSYYWRVRSNAGGAWSGWSAPWRFEIAAQSQWRLGRAMGDPTNRLEIARDPGDGATPVLPDFDLTALNASQDKDYWYFGFNFSGSLNSTYVIYLDRDNRNNSGATVDKRNYPIVSNSAHRPEYAIYIDKNNGAFNAANVFIYQWMGSAWDSGRTLAFAAGQVFSDANYIEIKVPYQTIGMQLETGTYSLALMSVDRTNNTIKDAVPDNPITSGSVNLKNITTVSEHLPLSMPISDLSGDPATVASFPPFFWNSPVGSPWAGYIIEFYLDSLFSQKVGTFTIKSSDAYYVPVSTVWADDIGGDNTYYWRIRPRYLDGLEQYGSWSQAFRFERQGFTPQNLQVSVTSATPTFSWDRVEGANMYRLEVATDTNFSSPRISVSTTETEYTPDASLANGTYYWRVQVSRKKGEIALWSVYQPFTLSLPSPSGLSPNGSTVTGTPTFCWNTPIVMVNGNPVLYPTQYKLMVSKGDPTFSTPYETVTTDQNCYTPSKGYADDGNYYWKVAMLDGQNNMGAYSSVANFQKMYPIAKPLFPVNGQQLSETPTFRWTAADGVSPFVYGAATYRLEISLNPTFSPLYETVTTHLTSYTPTTIYASDKTYYWRVAIVDKNGNVGPYTQTSIQVGRSKVFIPLVRR